MQAVVPYIYERLQIPLDAYNAINTRTGIFLCLMGHDSSLFDVDNMTGREHEMFWRDRKSYVKNQ